MGNGSSQSIALGPPRYQQQTAYTSTPSRHSAIPKYAHPHNRVLPLPVAGPQRLRTTDNGSILHAAGTIRGHKTGQQEQPYAEDLPSSSRRSTPVEEPYSRNYSKSRHDDFSSRKRTSGEDSYARNYNHGNQQDSYGMDDFNSGRRRMEEDSFARNRQQEDFSARRRTSDRMEEDSYPNLRNHRMFHSDPNIARRPGENESGMVGYSNNNNRRSYGGGAAARASNMKYKKKTRAPEPPNPMNNSLPRHLEKRRQQQQQQDDMRNKNNAACKCIAKTRAPQPPPAIVVHPPPPPPPLPSSDSVTTRTSPQSSKLITESSSSKSPQSSKFTESRSPSVTRAVECRTSYEKKVHPLEKWRNCRSAGDVRIDEGEEEEDEGPPSGSRTTVFDSRKISEGGKGRIPSYLPQKPDPFQKEIQAVTKKIAQSRQLTGDGKEAKDQVETSSKDVQVKATSSPPKFYFADPTVFKTAESAAKPPLSKQPVHEKATPHVATKSSKSRRGGDEDETTVDEVVPSLQRFSPARRRVKSPTAQHRGEDEWEHLSKSLYHDSEIDVRLRPVLPRKTPEVPKFSSSEAWQALGSDGLGSSNHSTSDEGRLSPYKRGNPANDRTRRFSDMDYNLINGPFHQHRSLSDSHWTPRQDLMDDSDVSSENTSDEEAVVPKIRPGLGEISTRFSLPTVMFSNMRPIGTEVKSPAYVSSKLPKKKTAKRADDRQVYEGGNLRRFLTKKNSKYQSEEDVAVSDSNWTFGQSGLQKRGKQYSSELLLSDRKKYELMDNFGDFLGDILMSKSNHMRNQMKSSDSGNSNFSFYSTEGQVLYAPDKGRFVTEEVECLPPSKGRVYDMRKRFDANLAAKSAKKKAVEMEVGRRRDLELAKMLEDEVRRRRNKEKIGIRQQLQKMKHRLHDDDDDFDDEAYFTEPKSREEDSPFSAGSELGLRPARFFGQGSSVTAVDSSTRLSHWQSSPALLEDSIMKNGMQSMAKGRLSLSSVMSSPESEWPVHQPQLTKGGGMVDNWLIRQQQLKSIQVDRATDADVSSSSPSPATVAPPSTKKERKGNNIYKQLMDIVRKEERQLKKSQRTGGDSRESSYSQRESSSSTTSESSSTSSYSDSASGGGARNGVCANKEFGYRQHPSPPSFQVNFVQPYSPASKAYRPVPFEGVTGCRLPGLQEEGKHLRAEVS